MLELSPDSRSRSALINAIGTLGVDPAVLAVELARISQLPRNAPDGAPSADVKNAYLFDPVTSMQRALIMALAGCPKPDLERLDLVEGIPKFADTLAELYRNSPDAGVHSAAELALRRCGKLDRPSTGQAPRRRDPNAAVVRQLVGSGDGRHRWTARVRHGRAAADPDRDDEEPFHRRRIPRRYAISSKKVTIEEFQRYALEKLGAPHKYKKAHSPDEDGPQVNVSWVESAAFCNWLSKQEGFPECYVGVDNKENPAGMRLDVLAVAKGAYRLPTDAEWEYACRAGTITSRYYGHSLDLLGAYEWYVINSGYRAHTCGELLPNDLGLFDMLGNVMEWCHDRYSESQPDFKTIVDDNIMSENFGTDKRILRSSKYNAIPLELRSAGRGWFDSWDRRHDLGFRVARTLP